MRMRAAWIGLLASVLAATAAAQEDVVLRAMRDEMSRSMQGLKLPDSPQPYFIAYRVDMVEMNAVGATLGSLLPWRPQRADMIGVEVRVGDPSLDNTNFLSLASAGRGPAGFMHGMRTGPLQEDYEGIRRELWRATDDAYKHAVEDYAAKRAMLANRTLAEPLPDFSTEPPAHWSEAPRMEPQDHAAEQLARELSAVFRKFPQLYASSVEISLRSGYVRYLNSEGSWFARRDPEVKLEIRAETQSPDGMPLGDSYAIYAKSLAELPPRAELLERAERLGARLQQLRTARQMTRYNGPVLFEDAAAAEMFARVFAPALVAVRKPLSDNAQFEMLFERILGQTGGSLMDRIGGRVLPATVTVVNDPGLTEVRGVRLPASMQIDDEAVPARKMTLVENGILKALLTSRTPVPSMARSTGSHRGIGPAPTTLLVTADQSLPAAELRKELLRLAKQRGNDYGIVVRRVGRGKLSESLMDLALRMSGRETSGSDSFFETYRLYSDGREELVRGAQIESPAVANFKEITAVGGQPVLYSDEFLPRVGGAMFSGMSTAAGSGLPVVSYSVPSLLFEELTLKPVEGPFPALPAAVPPLLQAAGK